MTLAGWLAALSVGLLAGAISGLVGIGGGAVMVPFLYFFLAHPEWSGVQIPGTEQGQYGCVCICDGCGCCALKPLWIGC